MGGGGEVINKTLGRAKYSLAGINFFFTKVEAHAGMAEELVRKLVIKEALKIEIKLH